eukprot:TRINITY_DN11599_c4_g1_i1.p1 TRINITY_DN11599_c4_g1~~TRINITY_DN11599_c4_g1_i1.p1  ORF type:complete len:278 (+),score=42.42 TRINITY_DN11599_c4_g1_i1:37-870(+)
MVRAFLFLAFVVQVVVAELRTISFYAQGLTYSDYYANKKIVDDGFAQDIPANLGIGSSDANNKVAAVSAEEVETPDGDTLLFKVVFDADELGIEKIESRNGRPIVFLWTNKDLESNNIGFLNDVSADFEDTPQPTPTPPTEPQAQIGPCEERLPAGAECTAGARPDQYGYCECTQAGYACDVRRGVCRKLVTPEPPSAPGPEGSELLLFGLLIVCVIFCLGNMCFYQKKGRLPFWVNNMCCTCPPVLSCDKHEKEKGAKGIEPVKKKNPIDTLNRAI